MRFQFRGKLKRQSSLQVIAIKPFQRKKYLNTDSKTVCKRAISIER